MKLPKNYDPNATPDPERWLPKFERSAFLKKKKKEEKNIYSSSSSFVISRDKSKEKLGSKNLKDSRCQKHKDTISPNKTINSSINGKNV